MNKNDFALDKIKSLYKNKNMTVESFANLIGKSKSAWLRRESGEIPLTLDEVELIAEKLGSEFGTLVNENNKNHIENKGLIANSGNNAALTINLTQDQLGKVIDALK